MWTDGQTGRHDYANSHFSVFRKHLKTSEFSSPLY